jgi:hypothetical protein
VMWGEYFFVEALDRVFRLSVKWRTGVLR